MTHNFELIFHFSAFFKNLLRVKFHASMCCWLSVGLLSEWVGGKCGMTVCLLRMKAIKTIFAAAFSPPSARLDFSQFNAAFFCKMFT